MNLLSSDIFRPELRTKKILTVIFTLNKEITLLYRDHKFEAEIFE